jgi:hypothetical protein
MSSSEQREEVQRILQSAQFRRAPKLQRFLELVCDYHFQGRSADINEFAIATQAFGKGPDFEPSEDSLVRVQAAKFEGVSANTIRARENQPSDLGYPDWTLRSGLHLA